MRVIPCHAVVGVGRIPLHSFSLALDLPETFFGDNNTNPPTMRSPYYPPQTDPEDDRIIGINAYSEASTSRVQDRNDIQLNALPIPGTPAIKYLRQKGIRITWPIAFSIGDLLAQLTNDAFRSAVRGVVNRSGVPRCFISTFVGVDPHITYPLLPLPVCVSPGRPPEYGLILAGDHVRKRLKERYH
ncbi:hypothetical protein EDD16DRAFT_1838316 [Pisolithus croceorrhizus]|nr:hypothetical protein EDD16DRAFT_1838316 [Pisolithus croceorrhizus]KAI6111695.1 hypothetical protein EV401DRAFT_1868226 [Pisolithus croceorrhizus]KAI6158376.1 hypothetical protein EDD17DRAFT_1488789 [Pisolithus thermaeus]